MNFLSRALKIRKYIRKSTYTRDIFTRHMDRRSVRVIFELGSNNAWDAVALRAYFKPEHVYAFECNPSGVAKCRQVLDYHSNLKNITLIEKAAWSEGGRIPFYPVVSSNAGASSCYRSNDGCGASYVQERTEVEAVRLDEFCRQKGVSRIDLICMDLQGAEYEALAGLGSMLRDVRYVITELQHEPSYHGQALFGDVKGLLERSGFRLAAGWEPESGLFGDYLFIHDP